VSCRHALSFATICFAVIAGPGGCSRPQADRIERLALLPFENLTPDARLDWISQAVPGTLSLQLASAPNLNAITATAPRDVPGIRATQALFGYVTAVGGRLHLTAQLRDTARQKTIRTVQAEGDLGAGMLPLVDRIALDIYPRAQPATHRNEAAVRDYWLAVTSDDAGRRSELLNQSLATDPAFAPAHLARVQFALGSRDAKAASAALAEARRVSGAFTPLERARLDLLEARARQDGSAMLRALTELTRLAPANDDLWRSLGELQLSRRDLAAASTAFERSLQSDPGNTTTLNTLAYTRAYAGDLEGAQRALARYAEMAPGDANLQDTLGDVHFHLGRFGEAEKYYLEANRLNPSLLAGGDLYRAALAARFAGDLKRADAHFANWLAVRKGGGDPLLTVREAVWEASTGRLDQARTRLRQLADTASGNPDVRTAAAAQLALFNKTAGEQAVAPVVADNASAAIAGFLCQPDADAQEWTRRAQPLPPQVRATLLGYALLLNRHFKEAVPVWRSIYGGTHPTADSDARVMLAWALSGSGQAAEAAQLLTRAPIPGRAAEPGLSYLTTLKYGELSRR
jgi:tetratricopeptide (TPR) repeat protein